MQHVGARSAVVVVHSTPSGCGVGPAPPCLVRSERPGLAPPLACFLHSCRSLMSCCPVPSRDGVHVPDDDLLAESSPSTVCNWEEEFFDTFITYAGTSASKVGLFRVTWCVC